MLTPWLLGQAEPAIRESPLARERFDMGYVERLFGEQRSGRADHAFRIWNLWNLVEWHRCWFEAARGRGVVATRES